ncbi:DUF167 domain-containing protein [Candidatus Peregrinibacteria bacterium]|jgi:uncharacterized protein YggU (UPF0235/DUF167 family)|nr:DUF167 domain-containing protein [Candidatus Peregrinibacteria bacterium]MBT4055874.1 DUF167 domain-containing protein [Candidatus Peregrinibacteria bacterium]
MKNSTSTSAKTLPKLSPGTNYLRVKVSPKRPKTELTEILEEQTDEGPALTYKIRIKAAPEKSLANKELIRFLSKELNIPKNQISILSGKTDQLKLIKITN